jgi:hypothetical protein
MYKRLQVDFTGGLPALYEITQSPNQSTEQRSKSERDYESSVEELCLLLFLFRIESPACSDSVFGDSGAMMFESVTKDLPRMPRIAPKMQATPQNI